MIEYKSDVTSEKYRKVGNDLFRKGQLIFAQVAYNKAICYAESNETLALAYANRSAVYLEDGKYSECLQNIEWARKSGYPKKDLEKLKTREEKCKKLQEENNDKPSKVPDKYFTLSYPANKKIPFIVECLENRDGKLFATRDMKPGDVIAIEEFQICFLPRFGFVDRCYNCCRVNSMNLIPCLQTASLMYCSPECRDQFEVTVGEPVINGIKNVVRKGIELFGGEKKFEKEIKLASARGLLQSLPNADLSDLKNNKKCMKDMWRFVFTGSGNLNFQNTPKEAESLSFCGNNKTINSFSFNIYLMYQNWIKGNGGDEVDFGPVYLNSFFHFGGLSRLFQHACWWNTTSRVVDGNKFMHFIVKPVKAGEQLTHTKIGNWLGMPKAERELRLKPYYFNKCECFICKNNITPADLRHDGFTCLLYRNQAKDLTTEEILHELTASYQRIEEIHEDPLASDLHILLPLCATYMEQLATKKFYLAKGRCCFCSPCAIKAIKI